MYPNSYCIAVYLHQLLFGSCKLSGESLHYTCDYEHIFLHGIINCLQKAILQCHKEFMFIMFHSAPYLAYRVIPYS